MGWFRKKNMDARVIISKETMEKNKISLKRKGELRFEKLKEIAENGALQKCKTRSDVAQAVGYGDGIEQRKAGYAWVRKQVKDGKLIERLAGRNPMNNQAEYEYSLGEEKFVPYIEPKPVKEPRPEVIEKVTEKVTEKIETKVSIKVGEISVEIVGAPAEYAKTIIETIIK